MKLQDNFFLLPRPDRPADPCTCHTFKTIRIGHFLGAREMNTLLIVSYFFTSCLLDNVVDMMIRSHEVFKRDEVAAYPGREIRVGDRSLLETNFAYVKKNEENSGKSLKVELLRKKPALKKRNKRLKPKEFKIQNKMFPKIDAACTRPNQTNGCQTISHQGHEVPENDFRRFSMICGRNGCGTIMTT